MKKERWEEEEKEEGDEMKRTVRGRPNAQIHCRRWEGMLLSGR